MPPRPRLRVPDRTVRVATKRHDEDAPTVKGEVASVEGFVPVATIPARPRPVRKPIRRAALSSLPPSSPPLLTSSHEQVPPGNMEPAVAAVDDPFGFFAAEKRLKERSKEQMVNRGIADGKERRVLQPRQLLDENRPESVLAAMGIRTGKRLELQQSPEKEDKEVGEASDVDDGRPAFATPPKADRTDSDLEFDMSKYVSGTETPAGHTPDPRAATPRQRRKKKRKLSLTPNSSSKSPIRGHDELSSALQSPSPLKRPRVTRRPFADMQPRDNTPVKATSKQTKGGKPVYKTHKTDETLAEEHFDGMTEALKELLPRRPTRKATQRRSTVATRAVAPKKTRKNARQTKPRSKKPVMERVEDGEDFQEKEGESFVLSGEEREKFEVAREARKEYFKEVDDYVMDEESIFII
ncbi:uncharacterized protein FOMMEDRAFT_150234 [Fomitiporia mediterranea MF3/22]|uniref:uncharacterized protein n=1 Tax=Fomitiporia mediterranea (strain MF3/22) TaxID=694068 RepID=UPI0004407482|nr:uncharacterized protein FOMMEDRAFT_150234 [Fomitiporia mediterranea MF3/22]EJD07692.1 hypothetical protein FOMMEDRAFT_150234 [Fomitiporia mediterranea MF3/22]